MFFIYNIKKILFKLFSDPNSSNNKIDLYIEILFLLARDPFNDLTYSFTETVLLTKQDFQ